MDGVRSGALTVSERSTAWLSDDAAVSAPASLLSKAKSLPVAGSISVESNEDANRAEAGNRARRLGRETRQDKALATGRDGDRRGRARRVRERCRARRGLGTAHGGLQLQNGARGAGHRWPPSRRSRRSAPVPPVAPVGSGGPVGPPAGPGGTWKNRTRGAGRARGSGGAVRAGDARLDLRGPTGPRRPRGPRGPRGPAGTARAPQARPALRRRAPAWRPASSTSHRCRRACSLPRFRPARRAARGARQPWTAAAALPCRIDVAIVTPLFDCDRLSKLPTIEAVPAVGHSKRTAINPCKSFTAATAAMRPAGTIKIRATG